MAKRKKRCGHFCWCCQRVLRNERFSGPGHARHLCRQCSRLAPEELTYRQHVRNIDRLLDRGSGCVRRRHRAAFERFLAHRNERVRCYAEEIDRELRRRAEEFSEAMRADEETLEAMKRHLDAKRRGAPTQPRPPGSE